MDLLAEIREETTLNFKIPSHKPEMLTFNIGQRIKGDLGGEKNITRLKTA